MSKLIAKGAIVSKHAKLEYPVRVFAYAGISGGAEIGRYSYINRYTHIHKSVRMGRFCSIGRAADIGAVSHPSDMLSMHPFQYNRAHFEEVPGYKDFERTIKIPPRRTTIGHDVWVGAKGVIAGGVTVGTGALIGANAFVREDVPPYAVVVGTPAKILRYRFEPDLIEQLLASNWWDLEPAEMEGIQFDDVPKALKDIEARFSAKRAVEKTNALLKAADAAKDAGEVAGQTGETSTAADASAEGELFLHNLGQSLADMMLPEQVIDLVLAGASEASDTYDPLDVRDQEIVGNKLSYLDEFLRERSGKELTANEKRHIIQLFGTKH